MGYTTDQKWKLMNAWEKEITDICLRGTDLVPDDVDLPRLRALADMIYDLSEGRNEVIFDKLGRPNIMVNFMASERSWLSTLSGDGAYFDVPSSYTSNDLLINFHPAFIVNKKSILGFRLGKYKDVYANGRNNHVSLYGLPPAYGGGGFTVSYTGLAGECDRINAGTVEGETIHNITRAEFCYLSMLSVLEGFQPRGANNYGKDGTKTNEYGIPGGYIYQGRSYHVLNGSGPLAWRHDGTPFGVWGLNGPTYEILHGYMTEAGKWLFLQNNDAAVATASILAETSDSYKALMPDGSFVARDTEGALLYDYKDDPGTSGQKAFEIATSYLHQQTVDDPYGGLSTGSITARDGVDIPLYAQLMLCAPLKKNTPKGYTYMRNKAGMRRVAWAGGYYYTGSSSGFGQFNGSDYSPSYSSVTGSGRVASILSN